VEWTFFIKYIKSDLNNYTSVGPNTCKCSVYVNVQGGVLKADVFTGYRVVAQSDKLCRKGIMIGHLHD